MRTLALTALVLVAWPAARPAFAADPSPASLLEAIAVCPIGVPMESPPACPERSALMRDYSKRMAAYKDLGHRNLADPRPAVRQFAVRIVGDWLVENKGDLATLAAQFATEPEPRVRQAIVDALTDWVGQASVSPVVLRAADDPDPGVRYEAFEALTSRFARDVAGGFDKVLAAVAGDPHPSVRQNACRLVGKLGDDRALPVLEARATRDASEEAATCLWGIVDAWAVARAPSQAAFELTLRILERTPRSPDMKYFMPLGAMSQPFAILGLEAYQARAPWFDAARLRGAVLALVLDRQVDPSSRLEAMRVAGRLKPSPAELAPILAAYADSTARDDQDILKAARELAGP